MRPKQYFKTDYPWHLIHHQLQPLNPLDLSGTELTFNFKDLNWNIKYDSIELSICIIIKSGDTTIVNFNSSAEDFINHSNVLGIDKFLTLILDQIEGETQI